MCFYTLHVRTHTIARPTKLSLGVRAFALRSSTTCVLLRAASVCHFGGTYGDIMAWGLGAA